MSRIAELINCVKIYNLCNHCDHFKCGKCTVDDVNCKEEIEKQIVAEIRADAIDECIALARAEIDFESQAEQKRFVEFMEKLKEQK